MMSKRIYSILGMVLLGLGSIMPAYADDDFNPGNPEEPNAKFKISTSVYPTESGYSSGTGYFKKGEQVSISCSAKSSFTFQYWTKDGVEYTTSQSFTYTMGEQKAAFVAHFAYTPSNPQDPSQATKIYKLFLNASPSDACSFNITSGDRHSADESIHISSSPSQGYVFKGWYDSNGSCVSTSNDFYYVMGATDVTLTVRYEYNPSNPDDPTGTSGGGVDNGKLGDINGDKVVDTMDAIALIGYYLNGTTGDLKKVIADVNSDSAIDTMDAIEIINKYLNNK